MIFLPAQAACLLIILNHKVTALRPQCGACRHVLYSSRELQLSPGWQWQGLPALLLSGVLLFSLYYPSAVLLPPESLAQGRTVAFFFL